MYNLVIDIGNSLSKIALFNNRTISQITISEKINSEIVKQIVADKEVDKAIMSTVKLDVEGLEDYLSTSFEYLRFNTSVPSSIINQYKTPATLGLDRYAAVIGVSTLFPDHPCLVIDAGTCITYDFIDNERNYWGGSISPGIAMRFKAMHTFTGKLPLIEFDANYSEYMGSDTRTALLSGAQKGVLYEVEGFINAYQTKHPNLIVALCGGDSDFFDTQLKNSIFAPAIKAIPNLVLIGLNEVIQQHND